MFVGIKYFKLDLC